MSKNYKIINKNSSALIDGKPKLPTAEQLEYGEIAINYVDSGETLSIKNSNNRIVTFSCDDKFNESFKVIDDRVLDLEEFSAITLTKNDLIETEVELGNASSSGKVVDALVVKELSNKTNNLETSANTFNTKVSILDTMSRRTRLTSFSLDVLKQAVADQNLEKYGLKVGDETTINGYTYVIAGLNPMYGFNGGRVRVPHVGLIVIPHTTQVWNAPGNTNTGSDKRGGGYKNCDLHYYLKNTTLPHVQNDLGSENLLSHNKLLSNGVNTTGYNRYGTNTGCASSCSWEENCYISALSEIQVYGSIVWSSSGYDTGEACQQLDVFRVYNMNEIFGYEYPWLRDIASASHAAFVDNDGYADAYTASYAYYVAALILFH